MASQSGENTDKMSSDQYFSKYDSLITESIERWHVPGVSIAVIDGDSIYSKVRDFPIMMPGPC
jgi:hypothetical protein